MIDSAVIISDETLLPIGQFGSEAASSVRLSSPAPGRSLGGTVTLVEGPIRAAVSLLGRTTAIDDEVCSLIFDCTVYGPEGFRESNDIRLTWFIVNVALAHAFLTRREVVGPLRPALEWFLEETSLAHRLLACFSHQQIHAAELELRKLKVSADLHDLLPYIIEPHGHVTRNSLETCDVARKTREMKKDSGVYYTPSDVADFMVSTVATISRAQGTWIDPACGTGVFLRAAIAYQRRTALDSDSLDLSQFAIDNIYGIDKSALATDHTAFVLLVECGAADSSSHSPFISWQRLKRNLICMDALRLIPRGERRDLHRDPAQLAEVEELFPIVGRRGFDHVVMNPPYAKAQIDKSLSMIWHSFSGIQAGQIADTHLAFGEMLWRITSETGASAAILPLSVGTNTTRSYVQLRDELLGSAGTKEFLFFDREPQALFGEDIKTRNLILFHQNGLDKSTVRTSRLLKWTAEQRPSIFSRDRLVSIEVSQCRPFIPKLGSDSEKIAYTTLTSASTLTRAVSAAPFCSRISIQDAVTTNGTANCHTLLVGSTAYNFINCFFSSGIPARPSLPYSSSPLNALVFTSEGDAYAAYALVSSRLSFWLWHVEGDGFHMTSDFLKRLPLWSLVNSEALKDYLSEHGAILWQSARPTAVGAVNGGKQTYSFHCGYDHPSAIAVEKLVIEHLQLGEHVSRWLDDFVQATVSIDGKRRTRRIDSDLIKVA